MATTLYADLAANYDAAITAGVAQVIAESLAANAVQLAGMITLYIIISGIMTMFRRMTMEEWVFGATRCFMISLVLTAAYFTQYIQTPLMTTIPNWIAQTVNGGFGAQTGPQQFDALRDSVVAREAVILQQASGTFQFGERMRADCATWLICIELAVNFIIWESSKGLMGLLVDTVPFLAGFYIFNATRHIPMNLAGAIVSSLVLLLMISILLAITLNADQRWLAQARGNDAGIEAQLDVLKNIFAFFLFGTVMTLFLPGLAGFIGRGVVPNLSPARAVPVGVEAAGNTVARGARGMRGAINRARARLSR